MLVNVYSYPLEISHIAVEKSTSFHGKTHNFDWAIFNSYVQLPEGSWLVGWLEDLIGAAQKCWASFGEGNLTAWFDITVIM